ncbi:MAG: hypothetical protein Q7S05_04000 [bacterium]|nr:hypothetical protein [bacterium]
MRRDMGIVALSALVAIILAKTGVLKDLLTSTQELKFLGSFLTGIFFTSVFTVIPASVVLGELAQSNSIWEVAILGGMGAAIGDLLIFRFVEDHLADDFRAILGKKREHRIASIFHLRFFRWLVPILGAAIVAAPFIPDEIGLTMMGLTKMRVFVFLPVSFLCNFSGILAIGLLIKDLV